MIELTFATCTFNCSFNQQQSEILEDHVDCKNYLTSHSLSSSVQMSEVWQIEIFFHKERGHSEKSKSRGPGGCDLLTIKFCRP